MFSDNENELLGRTQRILLELSTVLFFTAKNSAIPLIQQYVYFLVAKKYNVSICADDCEWEADSNATNASLAHLDLLERVNEESSLIVLYLNLAELLPAAVVVLFLGAWSDVTGRRKFLMWLPCLGNAVYALGFVLPWYINGGDVDSATTKVFFVMACIISGLSGSIPGFLSGNASYISDTDSRGRRTLRLAIVELSIGLTFGISNLIHGYWIDITRHFAQPLWFVFGCSLVPFFILFFLLREPNGEVTSELGHPTTFRDLKPIRRVFGCTSRSQRKLWAIFIVFLVYVFIQQGQERTFVLYLQSAPLYWRSVQIGTFLFVLYTLSGIGCWPGIPLMLRLVSDVDIGLIALLSKVIGSSILAFATETKTIYLCKYTLLFCSIHALEGAVRVITHALYVCQDASLLDMGTHNVTT